MHTAAPTSLQLWGLMWFIYNSGSQLVAQDHKVPGLNIFSVGRKCVLGEKKGQKFMTYKAGS